MTELSELFYWFWTAMIFSSVAWYFLLLFYVGAKGGREIVRMARALAAKGQAGRAGEP